MEFKDRLIQLLKKQIEVEKVNVNQISNTEKKVDNAAAELVLHIIKLDSKKHADVLSGLVEVLKVTPSSKTLWQSRIEKYVDPFVVKKELEDHLQREAAMITHVEEEIKLAKDEGLRLLLQNIADEEREHHKLLQIVVKNLPKTDS